MLNLVLSRHGIMRDETTLDPTCFTAPHIRLSEPHFNSLNCELKGKVKE